MTRREAFFTALAALMEEHQVTMCAREGYRGYDTVVEGIDFDFESLEWSEAESAEGERDPDRGYYCVELRIGTHEVSATDIEELARG